MRFSAQASLLPCLNRPSLWWLHRLHEKLEYGVFIDIDPTPGLFDSVRPDLEQTILDALDALMEAGNERIGFIGGFGNIMGEHEYP